MAMRAAAVPENEMPEIKIVTEVAGRVCALPVEIGASVGGGDDIAFVEAMKMEIPVASPAAGKLKLLLVKIDDVVAEGQVVAIVET
jgi:biotin carboxyl carrier protein